MTGSAVAAAVEIGRSPEAVYDIVSDITGIGRWAAETTSAGWVRGSAGPEVGAKFRGYNRRGPRRWRTTCTVISADRGRTFAFLVRAALLDIAIWQFDFTATPTGGCRVEQRTWTISGSFMHLLGIVVTGVVDWPEHNKAKMDRSLQHLKRLAESSTSTTA